MKTPPPTPRTFRGLTAIALAALGLSQPAARAETLSYFADSTPTTLQGWHNRVWDGTAWVDLAPDVTTMPAEINGGVILPAAQGDERNGLFEGGRENGWAGGVGIGPNGDGDKHANTLWLRSPLFVLDASGDLSVTLFGGSPMGAAPTSDAAIPSAAAYESAWMGVALRRISDGAFLLTKAQSEPGSAVVTFTQTELQSYVGVPCTLDLINMDKGGWGWTGMNRVVIPGSVYIPTANAGTSTVTASPTTVASDGVTASTVTVTVKDASGNPIAGKDVSLAKTGGAGTGTPVITTLVGTSNGSGVATFAVTCGTAGEYVFTATDESDSLVFLDDTVSITFATGAVSVLNSTVTASPTSITADGSTTSTVTVTLKDATNSAAIGKTVTLAKTSGPGSPVIAPASATTDGSGVATFTVASTTAGADVFTATGDSVTLTQTATVTFTVGAVDAANSTVAASPTSVMANGTSTSTITVTLKDANNNLVEGKTVTLTSSRDTTDTISPTSGDSDASGVVTFTVSSSTVGSPVFTATGDGVPITLTATVTFTQLPATITWGAATDDTLNGDNTAFVETDVLSNGEFVAAVTNGNAGTVNGVTFTRFDSYNTAGTYLITYGASPITMQWAGNRGDVNWGSPQGEYGSFGYDNGTSTNLLLTGGGEGLSPGTITLSSLIADRTYQVQIWAPTWNNTYNISLGGVNLRVGNPAGTVSQYVVGTFKANATSQPISWSGIAPSAISLRDLTGGATSNYASWATTHGLDPLHPEAVGNDGLTNLLVYALNLKTDGTNGSPGTLTGNQLSFTKRDDAVTNDDVTYAIEVSSDLGLNDKWRPATGVVETTSSPYTLSYTLPTESGGTLFARLVVTQK